MKALIIPDSSHWVAAQAPEELLSALTAFWPRTATERAWRTTPGRMVPPRSRRFAR